MAGDGRRRSGGGGGCSGNVFFLILLGVALFGALTYTFSRGVRQGGENVSGREADIAVSDMLSYGQKLERGVQRVLQKRFSETEVSFDHGTVAGSNAACAQERCKVFSPEGGAASWTAPPPGVNDGSDWIVNAANTVKGVGCDTADIGCTDMLLILPMVDDGVCLKVNERLGNTNPAGAPPADADASVDLTALFDGSFAYAKALDVTGGHLDGKTAGCFESGAGNYYFYYTLLAR